jgi:hypothetical protein
MVGEIDEANEEAGLPNVNFLRYSRAERLGSGGYSPEPGFSDCTSSEGIATKLDSLTNI